MKKKTTKKPIAGFNPKGPQRIVNLSWPQAKARFPLMKPYGDADGDGLKNFLDCKPFDRKRKGEGHEIPEEGYGFKMVYKREKKKGESAEELIEGLE